MLRNPNTTTVGVLIAGFIVTWLMLDGIRRDLKGDLAAVGVRLEANVVGLEPRLTKELAAFESRLGADIRETGTRLDRRLTRVENRLDRIMEILPTGRDPNAPDKDPN